MVLIPASNLLSPPLWGALADALRARLMLLRLACVGAAATIWLLVPASTLSSCIVAIGVFAFFRMPMNPLSDATVYRVMGGKKVDFSVVRVWGSIGFALMVNSPYLWSEEHRELAIIATTSALLLLAGVSTWPLRAPPRKRESGVISQVGRILAQPAIILFLLASTIYYSGHSMYDAYYSLQLSRLGFDHGFIGLAWSVGVVVEIGLMLAAPRFIHRINSSSLLVFCAAMACCRWTLLSMFTSAPLLLAIQPLHAVTFGLWYLSLVKHVQERAPEHLRTSLQSITQAAMGTGMVVGYLGGGKVLHLYGGEALYRISAGAAVLAMMAYAATGLAERLRKESPPPRSAQSAE